MSDAHGGVRNPAGLDADELVRRARGGVVGHEGMDVERITNESCWRSTARSWCRRRSAAC